MPGLLEKPARSYSTIPHEAAPAACGMVIAGPMDKHIGLGLARKMKLCSGYSIRTKLTALILVVVSAIVLVLSGSSMAAVDGDLDSTFGSGGKVVTDFFGRSSGANAIALQADGKILVTGDALTAQGPGDISVARYNSDGSLDTTFGTGGRVTTDFAA